MYSPYTGRFFPCGIHLEKYSWRWSGENMLPRKSTYGKIRVKC